MTPARLSIFDRRFAYFFWTQFLGALTDNTFKNALVMMVTFQNASVWGMDKAQVVPLAGGLFILPFFLFSPWAGQISDRMEKSRLVRLTKYWEVLIMLIAALGFYGHAFEVLLLVLFLAGVQAALFGPVKYSILPELVSEQQLLDANGFVEGGTFLAILLGTICGGLLVQMPQGHVVTAGFLFLLALAGVWTARGVPQVSAGAPNLPINLNPIPIYVQLYQLLRRDRSVQHAVTGISWFWFFGAAILSILPLYGRDGLGVNEAVVTTFLAVFTIGIGIGSMLCARLSSGKVILKMVWGGGLGISLFLTDLVLASQAWPISNGQPMGLSPFLSTFLGWRLLVDFFGMCISAGFFILPLYALMQSRSRKEERSRIVAANNILNALYMVMASLVVMGFAWLGWGYPQMFAALAGFNLMATFYLYFRYK